jgi:hypothetical protein
MPDNVINMYESRAMTEYLRQRFFIPSFLRDTFFRYIRIWVRKNIDIDILKDGRNVPFYVKPVSDGLLVERDGFETHTYEPPYLSEFMQFTGTDEDVYTRRPGEDIYNASTPAGNLAYMIGEAAATLAERFDRKEEEQAAEVLTTGMLSVKDKDGNVIALIDFGMKDTHKPVLLQGGDFKPWNDPTCKKNDILEFLSDYCDDDLIGTDSEQPLTHVIMGRTAKQWLMRKMDPDNETSGLNSIRVQRGEIRPQTLPKGVRYYGQFDDLSGADVYGYYAKITDPYTGELRRIIPDNMVLLVSDQARFDRNYGVVQHKKALEAYPQGLARFPYRWETPNGKTEFVQLESAPLFSPYEIDAIVAATVIDPAIA